MSDGNQLRQGEPLNVAICVATFKRPAGLRRLLDALSDLKIDHQRFTVRVVIVDNDSEGSSRHVCEKRSRSSFWPLHYQIESRRGIPFARNAAITACYTECDAIAFIDDDEAPEADWLQRLLDAERHYRADVVTGPAVPTFSRRPPRWALDGSLFALPRDTTGAVRDRAFTNNVLVNCRVFHALTPWFDERLRFTGGSDTHFFRRVHLAGFRIVWCDEAIVFDEIPAERVTLRWVALRSYRYGHTHAFVRHDLGQSTRLALAGAAALRLREAATSAVVGVMRRQSWRLVEAIAQVAYGAGMLANVLGSQYAEYAPSRSQSTIVS